MTSGLEVSKANLKFCSKTRQEIFEILSNYLKTKDKRFRDSFKLLQKQDKGPPRFFQTTSKAKHKGTEDSLKLPTSKTQSVPEILKN